MEEYIEKYDTFTTKVVYNFQIGQGGIGDNIKFFMYALSLCIKHNYKLYYLVNNISIEKYIQLKHAKMYIRHDEIDFTHNVSDINSIASLPKNTYNIVSPYLFYSTFTYDGIDIIGQDVFEFSEEVRRNSLHILPQMITNYISIHLRLGDRYLETDKTFVPCCNEERYYDEKRLCDLIEANVDKTILFFCENNNYKLQLKSKYNHIIITSCQIGHTGLLNTTEKQTLDTITELYLMSNSDTIVAASNSGFSLVASKFKNIPLVNIY